MHLPSLLLFCLFRLSELKSGNRLVWGLNNMWTSSESSTRTFFQTLRRGTVLLLVISTILVLTITAGPQTKTLRLASTPWSPFTNVPGKARFALDLVHTALGRTGVTAETSIIDEGKLTPALLNGEFDGSAALWRDDAREKALVYSRPYLENRLILVGRAGTDVSAKSLADLGGKRVALVEGYSYGDKTKVANGPTYVPSSSEEDSIQKLLNGGADYTLMDELVVEYILQNHATQARARLAFGSTPLIVRTLHFAVSRKIPDAQRIVDLFNAELLGMISDRSYHRLLQLDWISADVDGDGRPEYVPRTDQVGANPPDHSYKLFSEQTAANPNSGPRFYLGGKVYSSWSSVPDAHKVPRAPGTLNDGAQFSIFTFKF
jgi:ABC-type amino acid transport substrate-binding protein